LIARKFKLTLKQRPDICNSVVVKAKIQRQRPRPRPGLSRPRPRSRPGPFKAKAEAEAWTLETKTKARTLESKANLRPNMTDNLMPTYHTPLT